MTETRRRKRAQPDAPELAHLGGDASREYWKRLAAIEEKLDTLIAVILAPSAKQMPTKVKAKGLRRTVLALQPGTAKTAKRARVGRAAKRAGMTFEAWVKAYGMRDKAPSKRKTKATRKRKAS